MEIQLDKAAWTVGQPLKSDKAGFGSVFEATSVDGRPVVAKFVRKEPGADRELLIGDSIRAAQCRNVIPILDSGEHEDSLVLIMPRAEKSLAQHLADPLTEIEPNDVLQILTDVASALSEIDGRVVHRDLKPANILLLEGAWSLADFGIARYSEATTAPETRKRNLTPPYAAPEQWRLEHATSATDVYAFGVIAYELIAGRLPFAGPNIEDYRDQHIRVAAPSLAGGNRRLEILVEECLYKSPPTRPTTSQIEARLAAASHVESGDGASRLAQVSHKRAQARSAEQARLLRELEESERLEEMFKSATQAFITFPTAIHRVIADNAADAIFERIPSADDPSLAVLFGDGSLNVTGPSAVQHFDGPFQVVAFAEISVRGRSLSGDWVGRSHSLWYCDAHEAGNFAWHETAFMSSPLLPGTPRIEPFALDPSSTNHAFDNVMGGTQLAWPFEELDRADPSAFVDRWISYLADAADGSLARPSMLPERNPHGSWRR